MKCSYSSGEGGRRWRGTVGVKVLSRSEIRLQRMKLLRNEILPAAIWNICYANVNGGNTRTPRPNKFRKRKRFASKPFMGLKINRLLSLAYFFRLLYPVFLCLASAKRHQNQINYRETKKWEMLCSLYLLIFRKGKAKRRRNAFALRAFLTMNLQKRGDTNQQSINI